MYLHESVPVPWHHHIVATCKTRDSPLASFHALRPSLFIAPVIILPPESRASKLSLQIPDRTRAEHSSENGLPSRNTGDGDPVSSCMSSPVCAGDKFLASAIYTRKRQRSVSGHQRAFTQPFRRSMSQEARAKEKTSEVRMHVTGTCRRLAIPTLHNSGSSQNTDTRRRGPGARDERGGEVKRGPRGGMGVCLHSR